MPTVRVAATRSADPWSLPMTPALRRFLILIVIAVVLFFVISQPEGAADTVRAIVDLIGQALSAIATFFRSLF